MPADPTIYPAVKTVKDWNESIGTSTRVLFRNLSQALVTLRKSEWEELVRGYAEEVTAKAGSTDTAQQAWALIWISLAEAMFELTRELALWLSWLAPEDSEKIVASLDYRFEGQNLAIEASIFSEPKTLLLLEWIKKPFEQWLIGQGLDAGRAGPALERLDSYYSVAFFHKWLKETRPLIPPESIFDSDDSMGAYWSAYYSGLEKQSRRPYLAEDTFDTSQVYIPIRAYRLRSLLEGKDFKELDDYLLRRHQGRVKEVVDLEEELTAWIHNFKAHEDLCLIATTPGAGEGTFNRVLANRVARDQKARPLLIPLGEWDASADPEGELERYLVGGGHFPRNPVTESDDNFVLIFEKMGYLSADRMNLADRIKEFMLQISRLLEKYNRNERRMTAVVTGFAAVIKIVEEIYQYTIPLYHLLPLVVTDNRKPDYFDPGHLLDEDQRDRWWRRYGKATGAEYEGLPDELVKLGGNFKHLTANPTYNYIAACAWEQDRVTLSEKTTRSDLAYDRLMLTYDKVYHPQKPYHWLFEINPPRYRSVLKEIAIMSWHEGGGTVPLDMMMERFKRSGLAPQLRAFTELAQAGALSYLNYNSGPGRKEGLAFVYRGMPNYLVARRIFNELQVIEDEFEQRSVFAFKGLDDEAALRRWAALCGPAPFNHQILHYLIDILQGEALESAAAWQEMVIRLLNWITRYGLPLNDLLSSSNQSQAWARNAEEALLICHYACVLLTTKKGEIAWPLKTTAGEWIRRLTGQRMEGFSPLTLQCLAYLNFSNCILDGIDLKGSNLKYSRFKKSSLNFACLAGADLKGANLTQASLHDANLTDADLRRTYMRQTDINQSNLRRADLRQADLSRSTLLGADLRGADLRWTDLREADLRKVDLRGADLRWAYLEDVNLKGADLRGADLRETDLTRVKLEGADLTWADFDHDGLNTREK